MIWIDEMTIQIVSNERKIYVWRESDEEYHEDYIELTFISDFKRIKIWDAIQYDKKSKLIVISENIEKEKKLNVEIYMNEIINKELFDFWQEIMKECEHIMIMKDEISSHQN